MVIMNGETKSATSENEEDSFVVLDESLADRPNGLRSGNQSNSWQPSILQSSNVIPPVPETLQSQSQIFSISSSTSNMSPEEIQKRLHEVLKENIELKETLHQNNIAMKQQFSTLQTWQEEVFKVHQNHKEKFEETKNLIMKLKAENQELKKTSVTSNSAVVEKSMQLETENARLVSQNTLLQERIDGLVKKERRLLSQNQPNAKEAELNKVVEQLTQRLEFTERARRQQTIDMEKLAAQLSRTQQQLADTQTVANQKIANVATPDPNSDVDTRLQRYEQLIKQLADSVQKEAERLNSMDTWIQMTSPNEPLQLEITELRKLLTEEQVQSVARKENLNIALSSIQELFADFKSVIQELNCFKETMLAKENDYKEYDAIQEKRHREKIDSLTAQLVAKEEALAISERNSSTVQERLTVENQNKGTFQISEEVQILRENLEELTKCLAVRDQQLAVKNEAILQLQKKNKTLEDENETIPVLKSQITIYQSDFEAERHSREELVSEKFRLAHDLRHLQRRNQQLLDQLKAYELQGSPDGADSPPPKPYEEEIPPPQRYYCPNPECHLEFTTLEPLELHVGHCLDLKD